MPGTDRTGHVPAGQQAPRPAGTVSIRGGRIVIAFPYHKVLVAEVKSLPGRRYDAAEKAWVLPLAARPAVLRFAERNGFAVAPSLHDQERVLDIVQHLKRDAVRGMVDVDEDRIVVTVDDRGRARDLETELHALPGRVLVSDGRWSFPWNTVGFLREIVIRWGLTTSTAFDELDDIDPEDVPLYVTASGGALHLRFPYQEDMVRLVKSLPGARYLTRRKTWVVPVEAGFDLLSGIEQLPVVLGAVKTELLAQATEMIARVEASRALDADVAVEGLALELRPFQRAGVAYLADARRAILADDMGLGKTPQSLAVVQHLDVWPLLVLVPAVVKVNWRKETLKWLPGSRVVTLSGRPTDRRAVEQVAGWLRDGRSPYDDTRLWRDTISPGEHRSIRFDTGADAAVVYQTLQQADVVLANYDVIGPTGSTDAWWTPVLQAWPNRSLVADESQFLKNPRALRTRAAIEIARTVDPDDVIIAASGTPVENHRREYAAQLDFIGRLDEFGGAAAVTKDRDIARKLRARCMVRRVKADVLPELPAREHVPFTIPVADLDRKAMADYRQAEHDLLEFMAQRAAELARQAGEDPHSAAVRARMRAAGAEYLIRINVLRRLALDAKKKQAERWIRRWLDERPGEPLLVFGHHLDQLDTFAAMFDAPIIKGGVSADRRSQIVDDVQEGRTTLVFLQIKAGGTGLTMTAASNVLFLELDWVPGRHDQAIDRCYGRVNDPHGATGFYLVAEGTIEEWVQELHAEKRVEVHDATDGDLDTTAADMEADDTDSTASVYGELVDRLTDAALSP